MAYPYPEAEPFRIKMVEPLKLTTREERQRVIREAHYNVFKLRSEDVCIDLLTDSGTSAMSQNQWAGLMLGDESYAGCRNWVHLEETVRDITGYRYVLPTHQGRPAENILTALYLRPGLSALANMFFDTTHAHVRAKGGLPCELIVDEGLDGSLQHPFKGNIDVDKLEAYIRRETPEKIGFILLTVTCNNNGGQPVSMVNIRAVRAVADRYGLPFFLDAARFAENAFFIKVREEGYAGRPLLEIAREMFSYADGRPPAGVYRQPPGAGSAQCDGYLPAAGAGARPEAGLRATAAASLCRAVGAGQDGACAGRAAIQVISTAMPMGSEATPTVVRAGGSSLKNSP
jgi:tryptophanase